MSVLQLSRRDWLKAAGTAAAVCTWPRLARAEDAGQGRFTLSKQGCGRATGYAETNKIVTRGGRTHVAWLDSPPEGFRVRVRTLDGGSGAWSPVHTVGEAYDNHGGPALAIDSRGFLHLVYYPHHHAMRYRRSLRPGDASAWGEEIRFGERLTYPTLVCGADDTLYLTCRRSYGERPWEVELWKRPPGEAWQRSGTILRSRHRGYSHFQESLAWGPDHRTLHLGCRFHENSSGGAYGRLQTVAYLISHDLGASWQHTDGRRVTLPATAESAEVLAAGGTDAERILRAGAMAVDRAGRPALVYSVEEQGGAALLLARPVGNGKWQRTDLRKFLPAEWSAWRLKAPAGATFTSNGNLFVVAQVQRPGDDESNWGHPTNEVVRFVSPDGGRTFAFGPLSRPDAAVSHWLPNIERRTGHNEVPDRPGVIYTAGGPGEKNTELLSNRVLFARIDA